MATHTYTHGVTESWSDAWTEAHDAEAAVWAASGWWSPEHCETCADAYWATRAGARYLPAHDGRGGRRNPGGWVVDDPASPDGAALCATPNEASRRLARIARAIGEA